MHTQSSMPLGAIAAISLGVLASTGIAATYPVVDTGQDTFYDDRGSIREPAQGEAFFGRMPIPPVSRRATATTATVP